MLLAVLVMMMMLSATGALAAAPMASSSSGAIVVAAIYHNDTALLQIFCDSTTNRPENAAMAAVLTKNLWMLKWLAAHDFPVPEPTLWLALSNDDIETLDWLADSAGLRAPRNMAWGMATAAGHPRVHEWLLSRGYGDPPADVAMHVALARPMLAMLSELERHAQRA